MHKGEVVGYFFSLCLMNKKKYKVLRKVRIKPSPPDTICLVHVTCLNLKLLSP